MILIVYYRITLNQRGWDFRTTEGEDQAKQEYCEVNNGLTITNVCNIFMNETFP